MTTEAQTAPPGAVNMSPTIGKLSAALAKAQAQIGPAVRDSENPHFKSRFADLSAVLDVCRAPLAESGITLLQPATADGKRVSVCTVLLHESGEWLSLGPLTLTAAQESPQAVGSAITYARRCSLKSALGIAEEDDDGESAEGRGKAAPPPRKPAERKPADISDAWLKRIHGLGSLEQYEGLRGEVVSGIDSGRLSGPLAAAIKGAMAAKKAELEKRSPA